MSDFQNKYITDSNGTHSHVPVMIIKIIYFHIVTNEK